MQPLPGFRDFYPADFATRRHIQSVWRDAATRFGFSEYDGPPLEPLDLYTKKSGDEIVEQLYQFEDKGGRAVTLRPEMTPTFARMVGARERDFKKPIKWFALPQLFRYERQQRGRLREHFQFNADIVGSGAVAEDLEIIGLLLESLRLFGFTPAHLKLRLSSRELWHVLLTSLEIPPDAHGPVYAVIDKIERTPADQTARRLADLNLSPSAAQQLRAFTQLRDFAQLPDSPATDRLRDLLKGLEAFGFAEFVTLDLTVVRGLAYYTGVVFEVFALDADGRFTGRAVAGGGRYDGLLRQLSGVDLPAAGFGMGDVVLGDLLHDLSLLPTAANPGHLFIVHHPDAPMAAVQRLTADLRRAGFRVDYAMKPLALGKQFDLGAQLGAAFAIVCDAQLVQAQSVAVKSLADRSQHDVPRSELVAYLHKAAR